MPLAPPLALVLVATLSATPVEPPLAQEVEPHPASPGWPTDDPALRSPLGPPPGSPGSPSPRAARSLRPQGLCFEAALRLALVNGYSGHLLPDRRASDYSTSYGNLTVDLGGRYDRFVLTAFLDLGMHDLAPSLAQGASVTTTGGFLGLRAVVELGESETWIPWIGLGLGSALWQDTVSQSGGRIRTLRDVNGTGLLADVGIDRTVLPVLAWGLVASVAKVDMTEDTPYDASGNRLDTVGVRATFYRFTLNGRVRF